MSRTSRAIPTAVRRLRAPALACALGAIAGPAAGQVYLPDGPEEFRGVDVFEHRGGQVPLDLPLTTADGRSVKLRDYFDGEKPVVLILAYYTCPMQCQLVLNASKIGRAHV